MLKVVLVDDEPSVLEGLRIFADWEQMGFEIAGEASNGEASFSIIRDTRPELVICDIRMPGLNGLELIEKVNADISPSPKFMVLSGYNDFSYAQKALQLGALGYLTKPIDAEELKRELKRAAGIIENERSASRENLELIRYAANRLYNDIMDGKRGEKISRKARLIFNIPANSKIRVIQLISDAGDKAGNTPEPEIYDFLTRLIGTQNENCVFYNGGGSYVTVLHEGMEIFTHNAELKARLAGEPGGTGPAAGLGPRTFWALISGVSGGEVSENIYNCGKQLERLQTYCMLHPENSVIDYGTPDESPIFRDHPETGTGAAFPEPPFDRVVNAIKGNDAREVQDAVDEFFHALDPYGISRRLYSVCLYRLADVLRKMTYTCGIDAQKVILDFTEAVGNMNPACKKLALDMCIFIFKKMNINNVKSPALLENEIIGYIKANSVKSLCLQSIAEKFSLPAIAVSKIIRKRTGRKFNDYINFLRIEYAKTLLASENMKITAVCEESGYADYGYFTQKFRELTGVSPSEYKKKYL